MKICHLIGSLQFGGAEKQLVNLVNNIRANQKYVIFLTDKLSGGFYHLLKDEVTVFTVPMKLRYSYYYIYKIAEFLKKNKVDVLQTHMFWANLYGVIAGKLAGIPVIVTTEHGKNLWKKKRHYLIEKYLISFFADKRICVSKDILRIRKNNNEIPADKLVNISNGINMPESYTPHKRSEKVILGSIGRFIEAKDFSTLIKACLMLKQKKVDYHLFILGDGALRRSLETLIKESGLSDDISLPGFQNNIKDWLQHFDIFIISSIREGQPLVLLEAMAFGLPIVATSVGGIPDTIQNNKEGILINPSSPEELSNAIMGLIIDNAKCIKLGKNSRTKVEKKFSIQHVCQKYLELYNKIQKAKKR